MKRIPRFAFAILVSFTNSLFAFNRSCWRLPLARFPWRLLVGKYTSFHDSKLKVDLPHFNMYGSSSVVYSRSYFNVWLGYLRFQDWCYTCARHRAVVKNKHTCIGLVAYLGMYRCIPSVVFCASMSYTYQDYRILRLCVFSLHPFLPGFSPVIVLRCSRTLRPLVCGVR